MGGMFFLGQQGESPRVAMKGKKSNRPAPITPVRSGSWAAPKPQSIRIPAEYPMYYPIQLMPRTEVVVAEATRKYSAEDQLLPWLKTILTELTPDFCRLLRPDLGRLRMADLIHSLVVTNCRDPRQQERLVQEIRNSDDWLAFAKALLETSAAPVPLAPPRASTQPETREQRSARRTAVVKPILRSKGWKPSKLATQAGVAKDSVLKYLDGTRKSITPKNCAALAEELGLKPEELPE
jgi:hypothetical protein